MTGPDPTRRFAECRALCEHGDSLTPAEIVEHACRCAQKDAEAWARIRPQPQPQLELPEAA
jgi:hypothetical protein